jgi:hypothetical protein
MTTLGCGRKRSFRVVWSVAYFDAPITICVEKAGGRTWRYPKTVFTSSGFAIRLAKRLNTAYGGEAFSVGIIFSRHTRVAPLPTNITALGDCDSAAIMATRRL